MLAFVNTLSSVTAALHVVHLILYLLSALWVLESFGLLQQNTYFGKPELHQEAAGASRGTNKTTSSEHSTVEACLNFLEDSPAAAVGQGEIEEVVGAPKEEPAPEVGATVPHVKGEPLPHD